MAPAPGMDQKKIKKECYKNPLIIVGKEVYSGALLYPETLGGGG